MSPTFLRTSYQALGTSLFGVWSLRMTKSSDSPERELERMTSTHGASCSFFFQSLGHRSSTSRAVAPGYKGAQ